VLKPNKTASEMENSVPVSTMYIDVINLSNQSLFLIVVSNAIESTFLVAIGCLEGLLSLYISFILYIYTVVLKNSKYLLSKI